MDGEEDEASTGNEHAFEVGVEESAVAGAVDEAKCESEPDEEPVSVLSVSEPPAREFAGIVGGDAEAGPEGEGFERNGVAEKDLKDGAREEGKDLVVAEEISAAPEEVLLEKADLADTAAAESAIASEKGDLANVAVEESENLFMKGDLADVATAVAAEGLNSSAGEEREIGFEEGDEADAAAEEEEEEGEDATANVVPQVEAEGATDSEAVEETEMGREDEETEPEEEEDETKGNEHRGVVDETMEAETEGGAGETDADAVDPMEETGAAEEAEGMEVAEEQEVVGRGKRKRGKNVKAPARAPSRKKTEEDVCFICFDGGELVLCDRRSDCIFEAFFSCGFCDRHFIVLYDVYLNN